MSDQSHSTYVGTLVLDRIRSVLKAWFGNRISPQIIADTFHIFDVALILLAAMIAKVAYIDSQFGAGTPYLPYILAAGICGIVATILFHKSGVGFSAEVNRRPFSVTRLIMMLLFSFMLLLTLAYILKVSAVFSRGWVITWFALSAILLVINRACYERVQRWLVSNALVVRNVAIIGDGKAVHTLANALQAVPGIRIIATHESTAKLEAIKASCHHDNDLSNALDDIIIVTSGLKSGAIQNILSEINGMPVQIRICVDPLAYDLPFYGVTHVGQTQLINVRRTEISHWGHLIKKIEDYVLGSLMFLVAIPIFALIAIAIKIDSPGPVIFRQRRHGLNHRIITVYKFRTMKVMEDGDVVTQAKRNDQRVTRVGAFLRKTSLDELPQIFNVLRGEMSLVGPRPHALAHNEEYGAILKRANYASRHLVKPGITGWAQVNGFRGPTQTPRHMQERVRCDLEYIDNWSIWFDLEILLLTLVYGFVGKNAY